MQQEDQSSEELCLLSRAPLNRENMCVRIHVREMTKWGRRDRCDCARTCHDVIQMITDSSADRRGVSFQSRSRISGGGIRVVVGGISSFSGSCQIIPYKDYPIPEPNQNKDTVRLVLLSETLGSVSLHLNCDVIRRVKLASLRTCLIRTRPCLMRQETTMVMQASMMLQLLGLMSLWTGGEISLTNFG